MPKAINIRWWEKYWNLTLTWNDMYKREWKRNDRIRYVECICDCWNKIRTKLKPLRDWRTKSCWCYHKMIASKTIVKHSKTHWYTWTRFYIIYKSINRRCKSKKSLSYKNYWWRWIINERKTFEEFKNDMYDSYLEHINKYWEKQTTIDRINVNWNYCKSNCKRSTKSEQANNKRSNHIVEYEWKKYTISELCKLKNIPYMRTLKRINKWWNINHAIRFPAVPKKIQWLASYEAIVDYFTSLWY